MRRYSLRKAGDYEGAVREYSLALAADAHHFKAHFNRAFSNDKLGRCARRRRARVLEYSSTRCPCQPPASADGVPEGSVADGPCRRLPQRCGDGVAAAAQVRRGDRRLLCRHPDRREEPVRVLQPRHLVSGNAAKQERG